MHDCGGGTPTRIGTEVTEGDGAGGDQWLSVGGIHSGRDLRAHVLSGEEDAAGRCSTNCMDHCQGANAAQVVILNRLCSGRNLVDYWSVSWWWYRYTFS